MIYREWLVMRKAVPVFLGCVLALFILVGFGHVNMSFVQCMTAGAWFGAFFASLFGVALGNSSREGARVFWVLPTQRWQNALGVVAVDLLATLLVVAASSLIVGTVVTAFAALLPHNSMIWNFNGLAALNAIGLALAVYGWAAIVGMLGRKFAYVGVSVMPVLLVWFGFGMSQSPLGTWLRKPMFANPFALYLAQQTSQEQGHAGALASAFAWVNPETSLPALAAITLVGCVAAITLWSKSEVLA